VSAIAPFQVRTALRDDLAPCGRLFAVAQQEIEPRVPPWRPGDFAEQVRGEELLVAHSAGEVVGFLSLWRPDAFVHFLHVAPTWRRRGVGRRLLEAARAETDRPLELKCLTGNARALAFYRRLGWLAVNRSDDPPAPYVRLRQPG
jgi:ribosomal protein S18 acetylase RimI-like enzyme